MKRYVKDNKIKFRNEIVIRDNGVQTVNPTEEMILADGWTEYVAPAAEPYTPAYKEHVERLIRERYSVSDELAILRQRDTKQSEFEEYFAFCEECKTLARNENVV